MSDPKRYTPSGPCKDMTENQYGHWVTIVDHDQLTAERDALCAENERHKHLWETELSRAKDAENSLVHLTLEHVGMIAQRMAYAGEFQPDQDGLPDTGSIHQNIRKLKAENAELKAKAKAAVVMPEPLKRGDEGGSGEYGVAMIRGYNACLREVARLNAAAPIYQQRLACHAHPDAPHGFNRNASLTEDRYVCDCEGWVPPAQPQSESVMVPRELLMELRDAANECQNLSLRKYRTDFFEGLTKSADALLGGDHE